MFQLILHHDYSRTGAVDTSGHNNHGHLSHCYFTTGLESNLKALGFDGIRSRVFVMPSETLSKLSALRLLTTIWVDQINQRRNIIEGFLSFAIFIEENGKLEANEINWQWVENKLTPYEVHNEYNK